MKKTKYLLLGTLLIAALALGLCACDWVSPHEPAWLFRNCNSCHAGQIVDSSIHNSDMTNEDCVTCHNDPENPTAGVPDHTGYTEADCNAAGCHPIGSYHQNLDQEEFDIACWDCHDPVELKTGMPDHAGVGDDMCMNCHNGKQACALSDGHATSNCTMCHAF